MQNNLPKKGSILYGIFYSLFILLNTFFWITPIFFLGIAKLIPINRSKVWLTKGIDKFAQYWNQVNFFIFRNLNPTPIEAHFDCQLNPEDWHLIMTNHQSALDILVLQYSFGKKIPILKFLAKSQLKWVPVFGFAWWALGYPFMKRYSKKYIEKNPHKKGADLKIIDKALTVLKSYPTTTVSFIEGTRFTLQKHLQQQSPFTYLLKPKAGGLYRVVRTLGTRIHSIIDVTIYYPTINHTLWDYFCHRVDFIRVFIKEIPIPQHFKAPANEHDNEQLESSFRSWINEQWDSKDKLLTQCSSLPGSST